MTQSEKMVRLGGLELPTFWFVARRSIQLSYRRTVRKYYHKAALGFQSPGKQVFERLESGEHWEVAFE